MIRQSIIERFDREIRKGSKRDQVNEQFAESSDRLYHEHFSSFKKQAADLIFEGSGWGEQVMIHESDVNQQMKSLIQNSREKEIDKLQVLTQVSFNVCSCSDIVSSKEQHRGDYKCTYI